MTFNFVEKVFNIGGSDVPSPIQFYKRGFVLGGSGQTPSWRDVILSGNTALTLVNAKANGLNYVKLFGATEQVSQEYIDSVTLSGKCEQRNLPVGYTQVEYLESSGEEYIDLNYTLDTSTDDIEIEFQLLQTDPSTNFFGARASTTKDVYSLATYLTDGWRWGWKNNSTASGVTVDLNKHTLRIDHANNTLSLDGVVIETRGSATANIITPTTAILFGIHATSTQELYLSPVRISAFRKWTNGVLVQSLVSARRNSDNELGMYEIGTGNLLTNAGTGTFTAGADVVPSPENPMDIICNNGVIKANSQGQIYVDGTAETVEATGKNLVQISTASGGVGYVKIPQGLLNKTVTLSSSATDFMQYTIGNTAYTGIWASANKTTTFTVTQAMIDSIGLFVRKQSTYGAMTPAELASINLQLEIGSTATVYEPYYNYGSATADNLLSVGDYNDTQEVLSGTVTRNVGVKILDGTESWGFSTSQYVANLILPDMAYGDGSGSWAINGLSTHYVGTTLANASMPVNSIKYSNTTTALTTARVFIKPNFTTLQDFKDYLSAQYANGTPVIIVYPLVGAITENVNKQLLTKGNVIQTAGSLSDMSINTVSSIHTTPTLEQPLDIKCNNGVVKLSPNVYKPNVIASTTTNGVTYSVDNNGYIHINGTPSTAMTIVMSAYNGSFTNGFTISSYLISGTIVNDGGSASTIYPSNGGTYQPSLNINAFKTSTSTNNLGAIYITLRTGDTFTNAVIALQIQAGVAESKPTFYPYGSIYTDGTTETVEITGKNLFDVDHAIIAGASGSTLLNYDTYIENGIVYNGGKIGYNAGSGITIPVSAGDYTVSFVLNGEVASYELRAVTLNNPNDNIFASYTSIKTGNIISLGNFSTTFTMPSGYTHVAILVYSANKYGSWETNVMLEQGSTATAYEPYFNGGSATAENLFKVGTYKDEQEVLAGSVTRNVGIKVFDGTESWRWIEAEGHAWRGTAYLSSIGGLNLSVPISTHFTSSRMTLASNNLYIKYLADDNITSLEAWKQFLATQYANGTPVTVVYPLATPTTETVTAQPLSIQAGTNIVEITQASIDNLELEVSYKAGVAVTITEVENAQLDDNVEVTING